MRQGDRNLVPKNSVRFFLKITSPLIVEEPIIDFIKIIFILLS